MCGEAVPQRMWVHVFLQARLLGGFLASVPDHFGGDRRITGMPAVAWKQPCAWLALYSAPVLTQCLEQFWTEHHISVFASLAASNVNHHALAIDVADFQVCQLSASYSGGVERHQQSAMIRSQSCVDESRDFFLAEDRRKVKPFFRIGRLGDAPGFLESFDVEESQSCQSLRNRARRQLALLEQLGLIFTNVFWAQTIWRTLESS